ncbi:MAG TPA: SDR family NAD(P)-dependent oxidoreductase, partial [Dongiaceae bacterium]|nr:SDR family NAD(P)-dependent oxidoreductase [Dongiaceae bacterium]
LAPLFQSIMGMPLDELWWGEFSPRLNQTQLTQPALFAFEYCLAQTLMDWGIRPDLCLGHSVGEYVAACIAGVLSLEDALRCIALRARCMADCEAPGVMVAVLATPERVVDAIAQTAGATADKVAIAAYNSPNSTVMSGDRTAVLAVMQRLVDAGVRCVQLDVSHAFHSPLMQPAANALQAQLPALTVEAGTVPVISNVSATILNPSELTPAYLAQHIVAPVRFTDSIRCAVEQGASLFIEIGPKSTLTQLLSQIVPDAGIQAFASIAQPRQPIHSLWNCLGRAYELGLNPSWQAALGGGRLQHVQRLPYPFNRQRLWTRSNKRLVAAAPAKAPLYSLAWQPVALTSTNTDAGDWLIVHAHNKVSNALAIAMIEAGARVQHLNLADMPLGNADDMQTLLAQQAWRGVILQAGTQSDIDNDAENQVIAQTETFRQLLTQLDTGLTSGKVVAPRGLWLVAESANAEAELILAPLLGFAKGASLEKRLAWGGSVEVRDTDPASLQKAVQVLLSEARDLLQVEKGTVLQPRLQASTPALSNELRFTADDAVLIAGGAGGIGLNLCSWCVERGLKKLLVIGRRAAEPLGEAGEALQRLQSQGVTVQYRQLDIADAHTTATVVAEFEASAGPLTGFIHAAGVASLRNLDELDAAQLRATLDSKLWGAWNLHQLALTRSTKLFALFSSISSLWGGLQLAHYAAANACLDALATLRLQQDLPVHCIQWGPWKEAGMAKDQVSHDMSKMGVRAFDNARAKQAFLNAVDSPCGIYTAVDADWNALARTFAANPRARLFDDLVTAESEATLTTPKAKVAAVDFSNLDAAACEARISEIVMTTLTRQLQLERNRVRPETPFMELGLDSILAVEIGRALEAAIGMALPATLLFDAPTAQTLIAALCKRVQPAARKQKSISVIQDTNITELIQTIRQLDDSELDRLLSA